MKKLLLISFLIISHLFIGQSENDSKYQTPIKEEDHFRIGKYDSGINWSVNTNKISLRRSSQEQDLAMYLKNGLVIALIPIVVLLFYKNYKRATAAKNYKHLIDKIIYSTIIKTTSTSESFLTLTTQDYGKEDKKVAIEILESQINFINKILANRNNKAMCKNIEKALENMKKEILTTEGLRDLNAKYKTINRVIELMSIGFNEEPALQKTKKDLTRELNNKTKNTVDGVLDISHRHI